MVLPQHLFGGMNNSSTCGTDDDTGDLSFPKMSFEHNNTMRQANGMLGQQQQAAMMQSGISSAPSFGSGGGGMSSALWQRAAGMQASNSMSDLMGAMSGSNSGDISDMMSNNMMMAAAMQQKTGNNNNSMSMSAMLNGDSSSMLFGNNNSLLNNHLLGGMNDNSMNNSNSGNHNLMGSNSDNNINNNNSFDTSNFGAMQGFSGGNNNNNDILFGSSSMQQQLMGMGNSGGSQQQQQQAALAQQMGWDTSSFNMSSGNNSNLNSAFSSSNINAANSLFSDAFQGISTSIFDTSDRGTSSGGGGYFQQLQQQAGNTTAASMSQQLFDQQLLLLDGSNDADRNALMFQQRLAQQQHLQELANAAANGNNNGNINSSLLDPSSSDFTGGLGGLGGCSSTNPFGDGNENNGNSLPLHQQMALAQQQQGASSALNHMTGLGGAGGSMDDMSNIIGALRNSGDIGDFSMTPEQAMFQQQQQLGGGGASLQGDDHEDEDGSCMQFLNHPLGVGRRESTNGGTSPRKKRAKTFPEKLMQAMMEHSNEDAVAWLPDGKSFVIVNPDLFVSEVLNNVFKSAKYASFIRKLHRWGFVRLTSGTGTDCFHHPMFNRNRREWASKITCAAQSQQQRKAAIAAASNHTGLPAIQEGNVPTALYNVTKQDSNGSLNSNKNNSTSNGIGGLLGANSIGGVSSSSNSMNGNNNTHGPNSSMINKGLPSILSNGNNGMNLGPKADGSDNQSDDNSSDGSVGGRSPQPPQQQINSGNKAPSLTGVERFIRAKAQAAATAANFRQGGIDQRINLPVKKGISHNIMPAASRSQPFHKGGIRSGIPFNGMKNSTATATTSNQETHASA